MKKIVITRGDKGISGKLMDLSEEESAELLSTEVEEFRLSRIGELASYRYCVETGGFNFNGTRIATDDRSKTLLMGARIEAVEALQSGVPYSIVWKTPEGYVTLDAASIIEMSHSVRAFVQACFDREKIHSDAIQQLTTVEEIRSYNIETGWPS